MAAAHSSQINTCSVLSTNGPLHPRFRQQDEGEKKEYDFDIKQGKQEKGTRD